MEKKARIYIAGHTGLVGSAIYRCLQEQGYSNLIVRPHCELDLLDAAAVHNFFEEEKPEYVFLAAAFVGGIIANNTLRGDFILKNLGIQQNVIGESFRHKVKKLIFLGSTCIYPKDAEQPIREDSLLTSSLEYTNEPYAIAKIAGVKLCESLNIQYGMNFLSVMPTNLYGIGDNFDLDRAHVLPSIMRKIHLAKLLQDENWEAIKEDLEIRPPIEEHHSLETKKDIEAYLNIKGIERDKLILWGTGSPLREFMSSEDLASAVIFIMKNVDFKDLIDPSSSIQNTHINIGTGEEISIKDLADLIAKKLEYKGKIMFNTNYPDGTKRKLSDISLLTRLGWRYKITLEEGIERMYNWYLESVNNRIRK